MKFLRTVSTRRLLALIAAVVGVIAGGTAIAVAASGNGPRPRPEPLAQAVHGALAAPAVRGITARVKFTNHLIDSSDIQGVDPLMQGASGRLWLSPSTHQLRLELQSNTGDAQAVVNERSFWVYDPASNTVYEGPLPGRRTAKAHKAALPSVAELQSQLDKLAQHLNLSGAIPSDVASQPTYTVQISPKHAGGLVGDAQLAWDALRGVPLRFGIYARGDSSPVLELKATDISYGTVPASDFAISPPAGAKVVTVSAPAGKAGGARRSARGREVKGAAAVAKRVPFALAAPNTLVGLPRASVSLLDWSGHPAALVTYGQGLGGIAVVEQSARGGGALDTASANGDHGNGLSLPTVSIDGATGRELDTALGSVIQFTRGNVSYTVLGSIPPATAKAAAGAL